MLKKHYANICFLIAIACFMLDGLGQFPGARLFSWGSAAFTAGFVAWELIAHEEQEKHEKAVEEIAKHASPDKTTD
jgi:hypothetical protein